MTITKPIHYFSFDPFESIRQLQHDFGDFIWDTVREVSAGRPPMNVCCDKEKAVFKAELPGVKKEDIEIEVLGNNVTVKGTRKRPNNENCVREERSYGTFSRNIQLPFDINAEGVEAELNKGILTITLPRKEEHKPKKVLITANK